ncbi:MAG: hypothetical protein SF029_24555 [bacterium]|nr:hypothetical protein [bacterium]
MRRYWPFIKWLGGIALLAVAVGLLFPVVTSGVDEATRNGVLFQAVPFIAFFIAVLLTFILLIIVTALRFNGKIAPRTYRPVETLIILGIGASVFALFQPFHFVGYKYGFTLLLVSTLLFIVWSHVVPASAKADLELPPFTLTHHLIAGVVAGVVFLVLASTAIGAARPEEPYGIRARLWNSYSDEQKAEIAAQATSDFNIEMVFLIVYNLGPVLLIYFVVREFANAMLSGRREEAPPLRPAASPG